MLEYAPMDFITPPCVMGEDHIARRISMKSLKSLMHVVNFGLTLGCLPTMAYAGDTWAAKAAMPTARYDLAVAAVNGKLYAIGGTTINASATMEALHANVEEFDPATNTWITKAPLPAVRGNYAAVAMNGKIYVMGGLANANYDTTSYTNTNYEYDPVSNTWSTKAPMPTARVAHVAAAVNGKIYVIGGATSNTNPAAVPEVSTNEEYDPATDTWATKSPMPTPRRAAGAAVVNGKIYVIGGKVNANCSYPGCINPTGLTVNEEYNPATDTWTNKVAMPTGRRCLDVTSVNGKIYAMGGWNGINDFSGNEEYDPITDSWTTKTAMPTAMSCMAAGAVNGKIYTIGGSDITGLNFNTNNEYTPPSLAATTLSVASSVIPDDLIFDYAEASAANLFPVGSTTASSGIYTYRYYPTTGNYLAVSNGQIYVLGPTWNNTIVNAGGVDTFRSMISTWVSTRAGGVWP